MDTLTERVVELEAMYKNNTRRIEDLENATKEIINIRIDTTQLRDSVTDLKGDVSEIKSEVKILAAKPGDRWEKLIVAGITAVVTGLIAALLTHFF